MSKNQKDNNTGGFFDGMITGFTSLWTSKQKLCPHFKHSHIQSLNGNGSKISESCDFQHAIPSKQQVGIWTCLICFKSGCSRSSENKCMEKHFQESGHMLVISIELTEMYCYKCDVMLKEQYETIDRESNDKLEKDFMNEWEEFERVVYSIKKKKKMRGTTEPPRGHNDGSSQAVVSRRDSKNGGLPEVQSPGPTKERKQSQILGADLTVTSSTPLSKKDSFPAQETDSRRRPSLKTQTAPDVIFGLTNLGNTCFFNSITQVILNCPSFLETLRRDIGSFSTNTLAYELVNTFEKGRSSSVVNPKSLFAQLRSYKKMYSAYDQQDSHECFTSMLEILEKEYKNAGIAFKLPFFGYFTYSCFCSSCKNEEWVFEESGSIVYNLTAFEEPRMSTEVGKFIRRQLEKKEERSVKLANEAFWRIPDEQIVKHKNVVKSGYVSGVNKLFLNVKTLLRKAPETPPESYLEQSMGYRVHQSIDGGFKCDKCKRSDKASDYFGFNKSFVVNPPAVLVILLKRFRPGRFGMQKDDRKVQMSMEIDLAPYALIKTTGPSDLPAPVPPIRYTLCGIVEQSGSLNGGHYICYVKKPSGAWYYISDSSVHSISESQVAALRSGYIYFYQRE